MHGDLKYVYTHIQLNNKINSNLFSHVVGKNVSTKSKREKNKISKGLVEKNFNEKKERKKRKEITV